VISPDAESRLTVEPKKKRDALIKELKNTQSYAKRWDRIRRGASRITLASPPERLRYSAKIPDMENLDDIAQNMDFD